MLLVFKDVAIITDPLASCRGAPVTTVYSLVLNMPRSIATE